MRHRTAHPVWTALPLLLATTAGALAAATNGLDASFTAKPLPTPDVASTLIRLAGAMVLVIAIFLGGFWMTRNWHRFLMKKGQAPKLNVLEARSLGARHTLYVVGYEKQRLLVATSAAGISLLTTLPPAENDAEAPLAGGPSDFFAALAKATQKQ
jgi:flagellar protein FliO/FliZ